MKQLGLFLVGMVVPFLQVGWAGALSGHAPYCHYTINISGSSTIYDDWMSFNGCSGTVGGFVFTPPFNTEYGLPRGSDGGTFDATFVADEGYVLPGSGLPTSPGTTAGISRGTFCGTYRTPITQGHRGSIWMPIGGV